MRKVWYSKHFQIKPPKNKLAADSNELNLDRFLIFAKKLTLTYLL